MAEPDPHPVAGPGPIVFGTLMPDGVGVLTVERSENAKGDGFVLTGTVHDLRRESRRTLFTAVPYQPESAAAPRPRPAPPLLPVPRRR